VSEPVLVTKRQKKMAHARIRGSSSKRGGLALMKDHGEGACGTWVAMEVVRRGAVGTTMDESSWSSLRRGCSVSVIVNLIHVDNTAVAVGTFPGWLLDVGSWMLDVPDELLL
jgi:hypothetical protein